MSNRALRFGVAGTGGMAARMTRTLQSTPGVTVASVASATPQRAAAFATAHGIAGHGTLSQMLATPGLDAIYVGNANRAHRETILAAAAAGVAVLCEKPFALDDVEAQEIAAALHAARILFMEAICTPFLPAFTRLAEQVQAGALGGMSHFRCEFGYPEAATLRPALFAADSGVLRDRGIYVVALALLLCGEVTRVQASLQHDASGIDTAASLLLEHANGSVSQLSASLVSLLSNTARVACHRGSLSLPAPMLHAETLRTRTAEPASAGSGSASGLKPRLRQSALLRRIRGFVPDGARAHLPYGPDPYLPEVAHFCALLRGGQTESPVLPLSLSLRIQAILAEARIVACPT